MALFTNSCYCCRKNLEIVLIPNIYLVSRIWQLDLKNNSGHPSGSSTTIPPGKLSSTAQVSSFRDTAGKEQGWLYCCHDLRPAHRHWS